MNQIRKAADVRIGDNFYRLPLLCFFFFMAGQVLGQAPVISYTTPQVYKVNTAITPLSPTNTGGAIPGTFGMPAIFAGNGTIGAANGTGSAATFHYPTGTACDDDNNVYIADYDNNQIRKITPAGVVSTFAGTGRTGAADGPVATATFFEPTSLAFDGAGNLFVCDMNNSLIRKITPAGIVSTVAGTGHESYADGIGTQAGFSGPTGIATDKAGNVYVADKNNDRIRKITPEGVVTTIAGNVNRESVDGVGTAASFSLPQSLTVDDAGNIYVVDYTGNKVRKIDPAGVVTTIAGSGTAASVDGIGAAAQFNRPIGITANKAGYLFVTEYDSGLVRMVSPAGMVTTLPGIYSTPNGPSLDLFGNLYVARQIGNLIYKTITSGYYIDKQLPAGLNFDPTTGTITGTPTEISPETEYKITAYNGAGSSTASLKITVNNGPQDPGLIFPPIQSRVGCEPGFTVEATSSNKITPIVFTSSNPRVATISPSGVITIVYPGTTIITAQQGSNASYRSAQAQQPFTVIAPPQPDVKIEADLNVCAGTVITFNARVKNPAVLIDPTYSWSVNGVDVNVHSPLYNTTLTEKDQISCKVINGDLCKTTGGDVLSGAIFAPRRVLTVNIKTSPSGPVCAGTPISFTAVPNVGVGSNNYQWQVNGQNVGIDNPEFNSTTLANGDIVTCIVSNSGFICLVNPALKSDPVTAQIITPLDPPAAITIAASTNNIIAGTKVVFTATPLNTAGNESYQWQLNGFNVGTNSATFSYDKFVDGDKVHCTITNGKCNPAVTSDDITIAVIPPVVIPPIPPVDPEPEDKILPPTAFTPNGDGVNDLWDIAGLSNYQNSSLNVYSRNGELLYHSKGYSIPWNGLYKGRDLPAATYYYVIDLGNNSPVISGYVAIIR